MTESSPALQITETPAPPPLTARISFALLVLLLVIAGIVKIVMYDSMDPDAFWHVRVGHRLLVEGVKPLVDDISFASVREAWTPYSWLAEMGMYKLWQLGGFRATIVTESLLTAGIIVFIALAAKVGTHSAPPGRALGERGHEPPSLLAAVMATGAAGFLTLPYLSFRPATAAFTALAFVAWLLLRDRARGERTRAIWLIVPLCAVLINIHMFALLVPVWCGALLAGALVEWRSSEAAQTEAARRVRRLLLLVVCTAIACCFTPLLVGVLRTAGHYQSKDVMVASDVIAEIRPFWKGGPMGGAAALIALMIVVCAVINYRRLRIGEMLWFAGGVVLLLKFGRFSPLFATIAAPVFATTMPRLSNKALSRPIVAIAIGCVCVMASLRVAVAFPRSGDLSAWLNRNRDVGAANADDKQEGYPCRAADFVATLPPRSGHLINEFNWGGYLAWRLEGKYQILLDGRTQLYSPEFWHATYLGSDAERVAYFKSIDADVAILPKRNSRFAPTLNKIGWLVVSEDDQAQVLLPPDALTTRPSTQPK